MINCTAQRMCQLETLYSSRFLQNDRVVYVMGAAVMSHQAI